MYVLEFALFAAICVASSQGGDQLVGHMELRRNVEGFPLIGHLSFFGQGGLFYPNLSATLKLRNDSTLPVGNYTAYAHSLKDFSKGCNSTGQFFQYTLPGSGRNYSKSAFIDINVPANEPPIVTVRDDVKLDATSDSIMNKVIVFHGIEVDSLHNEGMYMINPGLHQTSVFCGYLYPKCIPREEL